MKLGAAYVATNAFGVTAETIRQALPLAAAGVELAKWHDGHRPGPGCMVVQLHRVGHKVRSVRRGVRCSPQEGPAGSVIGMPKGWGRLATAEGEALPRFMISPVSL